MKNARVETIRSVVRKVRLDAVIRQAQADLKKIDVLRKEQVDTRTVVDEERE